MGRGLPGEVEAVIRAAVALVDGVDWEWVFADRVSSRRMQHRVLLAELETALEALGSALVVAEAPHVDLEGLAAGLALELEVAGVE